ncbi:unnamed protein product [Trichobilharzia szidati]|nr:unnamed protein product [Trichobilharzia szidati]
MLSTRDVQVVQVVLDGISNILAAAGDNLDQVTTAIEECGGLDLIESLQEHQNMEIYRLAYDIIERYFNEGGIVHSTNSYNNNNNNLFLGVDHRSELAIRLFIRKVFLDPVALPFVHEDNHKVFSPAFQNENFSLAGDNSLVVEDEETTNSFCAVAGPSSSFVALPPPQFPSSSGGLSIRYNWKASGILMKILRPYDIQKQLRLLFILYGPIHRGYLMWRTVSRNTAADRDQLFACFGELGGAICNMLYSGLWTSEDVIRIFENITVLPNEWLSENVACLLHCSGPNVASIVLRNMSRSGKISEAARILTSLCLVQLKFTNPSITLFQAFLLLGTCVEKVTV